MSFSAQHIKAARLHLRKSDPKLAAIIKAVGPFTTKARRDRFGTLVRSIVSQQIATAAAHAIRDRLELAIKENRKTEPKRGQPYCAETILSFSADELRAIGLTFIFQAKLGSSLLPSSSAASEVCCKDVKYG